MGIRVPSVVEIMVEAATLYIISNDINYAKEIETVKSKDVTYACSLFYVEKQKRAGNVPALLTGETSQVSALFDDPTYQV